MQLTFSNTVYTKANQNKKSHDLHPDTLGTVIFTDNSYVNNCACHVIASYHSYLPQTALTPYIQVTHFTSLVQHVSWKGNLTHLALYGLLD